MFLSDTRGSKRGWGGEIWLQEQEAFNKRDWSHRPVGKEDGMRESSVHCLAHHKSAGYEKGNCLEDLGVSIVNRNISAEEKHHYLPDLVSCDVFFPQVLFWCFWSSFVMFFDVFWCFWSSFPQVLFWCFWSSFVMFCDVFWCFWSSFVMFFSPKGSSRGTVWRCEGHQEGHNIWVERHPRRILPAALSLMHFLGCESVLD